MLASLALGMVGVAAVVWLQLRPAGDLTILNGDGATIAGTVDQVGQPSSIILGSVCVRGRSVEVKKVVPMDSEGIRVNDFSVVAYGKTEAPEGWVRKPLSESLSAPVNHLVDRTCAQGQRAPSLVVEVERTAEGFAGRAPEFKLEYGSAFGTKSKIMRFGVVLCPVDLDSKRAAALCAS
jgi:hypothetical protein